MNLAFSIIILLLLYFLAALFCCIETAFTSVNKTWLRDQAEQGNRAARLAMSQLEQSGSFFGTVLFGTNLVHVSITTLVGAVLVAAFLQTEYYTIIWIPVDKPRLRHLLWLRCRIRHKGEPT